MSSNLPNNEINKSFLDATDAATSATVLSAIANHYGITSKQAYAEVTDAEAEHLLDYLVEPTRSAIHVLMQRRGLA